METVRTTTDARHARTVRRAGRIERAIVVASAVLTTAAALWWTWTTLDAEPIDPGAAAMMPILWVIATLASLGAAVSLRSPRPVAPVRQAVPGSRLVDARDGGR